MQSIPVLICEGCDDSLIAQSLQLQRELAFSAFLSVCISHFRHFSQVWECVLHPLLQFNLVAKQFICGKGSLRPRKQKAEKAHLARKSLKAKITLHPTFNVFVRIAQTKLQKETFFTWSQKNSLHSHGVGTVAGGEMNCSENFLHSQFDSQVCRPFSQRCRLYYVSRKMLAICLLLYYSLTLSASGSSPKINQIVEPN